MVRDNRRESVYLFGAICPDRAVGAAVIMPAVNTEAMNVHLKEISTQVTPGGHALLVCDRAAWLHPLLAPSQRFVRELHRYYGGV